jgi:hypothetical protein
MCEQLEERRLLAATTLTNGTGDGGISVRVDSFGHYGSASGVGGNLNFDPPGAASSRGTTYHSAVYFSPLGEYLGESGLGNEAGVAFTSTSATTAVSSFSVASYDITLTQTVSARGPASTTLRQTYAITNRTGSGQTFSMSRHVDGDLTYVGSFGNDFAGVSVDGRFVYEFDTASNPNEASAYFGISSEGDGQHVGYAIQPFPYYDDIDLANGIPADQLNVIFSDADGNRITDVGSDITVSLQDLFTVANNATVTYTTVTTFGSGSPADLVNPGIFTVEQPTYTVAEGVGTFAVNISRTSGAAGAVTVDYVLTGVSATAGTDFTVATGTLNFADLERTGTFNITITDDAIVDPNEYFRIVLSNATGGAQVSPTAGTANVFITDNDATLQLAAPTYELREDGGAVSVIVTRLGDTSGPATVNYATADGTATAGADYTAANGTLTFAAGEASQTISIPVTLDTLPLENTETFTLTLSGVTGTNTRPGTPMVATVSLTNLDTIAPTATVDVQSSRRRITSLTVTFSETMAAASQIDPRGYTIWYRGIDGRNGRGPDGSFKIKSVTYDAATNTATIVPARPLAFNRVYQLSSNSPFLADPTGNLLDGNADGTGGDNSNFFFGRGTRLSYVDRDGDRVTVQVRNGGVIQLLRDWDGEAQSVSLVEDSGTSQVSGLVKKTRISRGVFSAGTTSLDFTGRASANAFNTTTFIQPA